VIFGVESTLFYEQIRIVFSWPVSRWHEPNQGKIRNLFFLHSERFARSGFVPGEWLFTLF